MNQDSVLVSLSTSQWQCKEDITLRFEEEGQNRTQIGLVMCRLCNMSLVRLADIGTLSNKKYSAVVEEVPPWMLYSEEHYRLHLSGQLKTSLVFKRDEEIKLYITYRSFFGERKIFFIKLDGEERMHRRFPGDVMFFCRAYGKTLWKNCCCVVA